LELQGKNRRPLKAVIQKENEVQRGSSGTSQLGTPWRKQVAGRLKTSDLDRGDSCRHKGPPNGKFKAQPRENWNQERASTKKREENERRGGVSSRLAV